MPSWQGSYSQFLRNTLGHNYQEVYPFQSGWTEKPYNEYDDSNSELGIKRYSTDVPEYPLVTPENIFANLKYEQPALKSHTSSRDPAFENEYVSYPQDIYNVNTDYESYYDSVPVKDERMGKFGEMIHGLSLQRKLQESAKTENKKKQTLRVNTEKKSNFTEKMVKSDTRGKFHSPVNTWVILILHYTIINPYVIFDYCFNLIGNFIIKLTETCHFHVQN